MWPQNESAYRNVSQAALANLSQTVSLTQEYVEAVLRYEESHLKESMVDAALLTLFFGLFTVLTAVAAYVLFSKGIKRKATAMMLMAVSVMWVSTLAYWIATLLASAKTYTNLLNLTSHISDGMMKMQDCLGSIAGPSSNTAANWIEPDVQAYGPAYDPAYEASSVLLITGDVALTINMVIGDSIVWWRAWVLWPDSRVVRWVGVLMIMLTSIAGAADTLILSLIGTQDLLRGDQWAIIAGVSSLLTNAVATTLIAYRLWEHRRIILSYLKASSPRTQVERTLALLVESGLLYCALWLVIVAYCSSIFASALIPSGSRQGIEMFHNIITACLILLIGMYPTLVIIVCAVDKSLYEGSADDIEAAGTSIVFDRGPASRRRGTLSELLSSSSAYYDTEETTGRSSEVPKDAGVSSGEAELLAAPL